MKLMCIVMQCMLCGNKIVIIHHKTAFVKNILYSHNP